MASAKRSSSRRGVLLVGVMRRGALTLAAASLLVLPTLPAPAARGTRARARAVPAADCQPFGATPCLLPFPNNLFTRSQSTSAD